MHIQSCMEIPDAINWEFSVVERSKNIFAVVCRMYVALHDYDYITRAKNLLA